MLRVPGSHGDLLTLKSRGADVRVVYSPLDARSHRARQPAAARGLLRDRLRDHRTRQRDGASIQAQATGRRRTSRCWCRTCWCRRRWRRSCESPDNRVQAFLGPGHVCAVMGYREYEALCARYRVPIVITGFEPVDLLEGILMAVRQLEAGRAEVENQYARAVSHDGNRAARDAHLRGLRGRRPQVARRRLDPQVGLPAARRVPRRTTPSGSSRSRRSPPRESSRSASAASSCAGSRSPPTARRSAGSARPEHPLGATMVRRRAPARRTTSTAAIAPHRGRPAMPL